MRHILSKLLPEYRSVRPTPQSIEDDARLLINTEATQQRVAIENLEQEIAYLQECLAKRKTALIALEAANNVFQPVIAPKTTITMKASVGGPIKENGLFVDGEPVHSLGDKLVKDAEYRERILNSNAWENELEKALTDDNFSIEKTTPEANNGTGGNLEGNGSGGRKEPEPDTFG